MHTETLGRSSATITLTTDELYAVNNALNEVCNGVSDLDDDREFSTRMGFTRGEVRELLSQFRVLIDRAKALPE